jgi:pimeloyl-ACP methyl ester carboxylesterase
MKNRNSTSNPSLKRILFVLLSAFAGVMLFAGTGATAKSIAINAHENDGPKPTIVLIHGAFADASGWAGVITRLQNRGYAVLAPANPLRGVTSDSAYIASVLSTITGPVVLVGHSYGGEVITNAASGNANVKALVYIAGFAPDEGETTAGLAAAFPPSMLTPQNLVFRPFPGGVDGYINPTVFREVFAADVPAGTTAVMAASQRPAALSTLSDISGVPAWKTIPSWYLVANQDHAISPDLERFMAARMHAHTVQIDSSHAAMVSHPDAVTDLILSAARGD